MTTPDNTGKLGRMTTRSPKKLSVLYADYSDRNIKAVQTALEPLHLAAFHTSDDRETIIELARTHRPDLILIGLYLDGIRGISTIRDLRQCASDSDPFCNQVPVLLGAPKLDRRAMRDAVDAGIEGVFRQPVDADRLRKIVQTVIKNPRRFVFEGNYFGPARDGDNVAEPSRKIRQTGNASSQLNGTIEKPARRHGDIQSPDPVEEAGSNQTQDAPPATVDQEGERPAARSRPSRSVTLKPTKPTKTSTGTTAKVKQTPDTKRPASGDIGIETANTKAGKSVRDYNLDAAQSVRAVLTPTAQPPETAKTLEDGVNESEATDDTSIDEELVEIDLMEALQGHRLWVDTGGKEGAMMSIEHADLRDADLEGIDLTRCALPHVSFRNANCQKAVLRRCDMTAGDFIGCNLDQAVLAASRLAGARFTDAILRNTVFLGSDLSGASFRGMTLQNCDLSGANLAKTDFRDADLSSAKGLFAEQIQRARVNANTRLPRNMTLKE